MESSEEVLYFYTEPSSMQTFVDLMKAQVGPLEPKSPLNYHINLVQLLACCTEGKNVFTEIRCHSLLSLDNIIQVVTHPDCITEVLWLRCCDIL